MKTSEIISSMYEKYTGDSFHMVLMAAAIVFLLITVRKRKENITFLIFTALFFILYRWEFTAKILMDLIGWKLYWRIFWLLPEILIISFAGAALISMFKKVKALQVILLAAMLIVIGIGGTCMYFSGNFQTADNLYKLPSPTIEVCDTITADAKEQGIEEIHVVVPNDLICYVRQYDSSLYLPYGREVFRNKGLSHNQQAIYSQMCSEDADPETLDWVLRKEGCNYFVWDKGEEALEQFEGYEFVLLDEFDGYYVFRMDYGEETLYRMEQLKIMEEQGLIQTPEITIEPENTEDYDPEALS